GGITLNTLTTALALISGMGSSGVPPASLMGTVNGSSLLSAPQGYSVQDVTRLAASLHAYLAGDLDPVAAVSGLVPSITGVLPVSGSAGTVVMINGTGFSPLPGDNVVTFGTATASVYLATSKQLITLVPPGASTGNLTVTTGSKVSAGVPFTVTSPAPGGGSGAFWLTSVAPDAASPGDTLTLSGEGFSPVPSDNTVLFVGASTVSATPTYADAHTLVVTIPLTATSGPVSVQVGGYTSNRYYLNLSMTTLASFAPAFGSQNDTLTLNGQRFGMQGPTSVVKFNGLVSQASIVSWTPQQIVAKVPGPNLLARVSGPITVITDAGAASLPSPTSFTATASLSEGFTGSAGAGTTAAWGAGAVKPSAPVSTFTQTDFRSNTNNGVYATDTSVMLNTTAYTGVSGFVPAYSPTYGQLGVDGSYFYLNKGDSTNQLSVGRYSLSTGAFVDSAAPGNNARSVIWDQQNNCYLAGDYSGNRFFKFGSWGSFTPTAGPVAASTSVSYMAANGAGYLTAALNGHISETCYDDWYDVYYDCSYDSYGPHAWTNGLGDGGAQTPNTASYDWRTGAAGFVGMNEYLLTPAPWTGTITALDRVKSGQLTANAVALPFAISGPGYSNAGYSTYGPTIGSDGTYLYVLGKNPAFNGGAVTLFKFNYAAGATSVSLAPSTTSGSTVTNTLPLPSDALWESVTFNRTVPAGTTCTVDVLDSAGNVLLSNITSGQSLAGLAVSGLKLRATLTTTTSDTPFLSNWTVNVRKLYAVSPAYNSGTNFPIYQTPAVTSTGALGSDVTVTYSDSADGSTWGPDVADLSTLTRRYVRFKVMFKTLGKQITRVVIPYTY
ncbi:MAG TPA: IPT/TIG domain-containing protein, partial [Stenomitos sp.]